MADYPPTNRSTPTRHRDRAHYDRETVHQVLDEGYLGFLGFVRDGSPSVLPMLYARVGERIYLHGSTGGRPRRDATGPGGLPVCLAVTRLDGLVLAKSAMHHSVNHRSVVVHGSAHAVTDPDERARAFDAILDAVVPGRSADVRPPSRKESAQTAVLALDLVEVSAKVRSGGAERRAGGRRPAVLERRCPGPARLRHSDPGRGSAPGGGAADVPGRLVTALIRVCNSRELDRRNPPSRVGNNRLDTCRHGASDTLGMPAAERSLTGRVPSDLATARGSARPRARSG